MSGIVAILMLCAVWSVVTEVMFLRRILKRATTVVDTSLGSRVVHAVHVIFLTAAIASGVSVFGSWDAGDYLFFGLISVDVVLCVVNWSLVNRYPGRE